MSKTNERELSPAARHLVALARRNLTGEAPKRNAASLQGVERALVRRKRQRRVLSVGAGASVVALAAMALFFVAPFGTGGELAFEVVHGSVDTTGVIDGTARGTSIRFSDGTALALAAHARTRVGSVSARGAEIALLNGRVNVHVIPRPGARWNISAGAYVVSVTGTSFDVEFEPSRSWLEVELSTGSVAVSGPLIAGKLVVSAGQRLTVRPEDGPVVAPSADAPSDPAPDVAPPSASADAGTNTADTASSATPTSSRRGSATRRSGKNKAVPVETWSEKVVAGRFEEVLALAEQRELDRVYREAASEDLQALADAARYARRADVARPALLALRQRFSASLAARNAAFFLGRLEESAGATSSALDWYEQYLVVSPSGTYASQALGRKLLIVHGQRGADAARPLAQDYLRRFPDGPYAAPATKLAKGAVR